MHYSNGEYQKAYSYLEEVLKEDDVAVLFFDKEIDEEQPCIVPQKVTQKGRIRKPSPGFFDQYMNDMDALL